jgi:hypothetical protein
MSTWDVEYTDEFHEWWQQLTVNQQDGIARGIELLRKLGPGLGRPHVDSVKGSRHSSMKELRTQCGGRPLRSFFMFDPRRTAIVLIGGDKTGDKRFYKRMIPQADKLYDVYLDELRNEDLI